MILNQFNRLVVSSSSAAAEHVHATGEINLLLLLLLLHRGSSGITTSGGSTSSSATRDGSELGLTSGEELVDVLTIHVGDEAVELVGIDLATSGLDDLGHGGSIGGGVTSNNAQAVSSNVLHFYELYVRKESAKSKRSDNKLVKMS